VELVSARLRERRDVVLAALERHVEGATWTRPEGGLFLQLTLTSGVDAREVLARAEGVRAAAGGDLLGFPHTIRLNYGEPPLDELEAGIERLARAIAV
jgi:DNA-binding transcriptional MocR family regulator